MDITLRAIGKVRSALRNKATAPKQGHENAPDAHIEIFPAYADALDGLEVGARLILLCWLDRADRNYLKVHPRGDTTRQIRGVFATRSPDRPNPIGLHEVTLKAIDGLQLLVGPLEALDKTPLVDIKPVLHKQS